MLLNEHRRNNELKLQREELEEWKLMRAEKMQNI
jgi:hypothetical protein